MSDPIVVFDVQKIQRPRNSLKQSIENLTTILKDGPVRVASHIRQRWYTHRRDLIRKGIEVPEVVGYATEDPKFYLMALRDGPFVRTVPQPNLD